MKRRPVAKLVPYPAKVVHYCPQCASESTHVGGNRHECTDPKCAFAFTVGWPLAAPPSAADRKSLDENDLSGQTSTTATAAS